MSTVQKMLGDELMSALQLATKTLVTKAAEESMPDPFVNTKQKSLKLQQEVMEGFEKIARDSIEAFKIILLTVELLSHTRNEINYEEVYQELNGISKIQDPSNINLSESTLKALFESCAYLLSEKRFEEAMKSFSILCTLAPNDYDHWMGYGHSAFHNKQYDTAIIAYYRAGSLRQDIPWPLIWAANACEQKGQVEGAINLLLGAKTLIELSQNPELMGLVPEIQERLLHLPLEKHVE